MEFCASEILVGRTEAAPSETTVRYVAILFT